MEKEVCEIMLATEQLNLHRYIEKNHQNTIGYYDVTFSYQKKNRLSIRNINILLTFIPTKIVITLSI